MKDKVALDIRPFTRIIWKNDDIKKEWKPKLNKAQHVHHESEWKTVAEGYRDVCTVHISNKNYKRMIDKLTEDGMFFKPLHKTARYSGFSHKHITPKGNENYNWYGVASKDNKICKEFAKADRKNDHKTIGKYLNFPQCCRDKFNKVWSKGIIDPIFEAVECLDESELVYKDNGKLLKIDEVYPESHMMLRYIGIRMTSHLPCSMKCEKTKEYSHFWKEVKKEIDKDGYNYLMEILKMPLTWDAYRGIVEVTTPIFKVITTTGFTWDKRIVEVGGGAKW